MDDYTWNQRNSEDLWNEDKNRPFEHREFFVHVLLEGSVKLVILASPDHHWGRAECVYYQVQAGVKGNV